MASVNIPDIGAYALVDELARERDNPPPVPSATAGRRLRGGRVVPITVLIVSLLFFTLPMLALARFALQNVPMIRLGWSTLFDRWSLSAFFRPFHEAEFRSDLALSGKLALGTVLLTLVLLLPTTVWVHLRVPKARAFIEFLSVLPYMIPPIALVAGIRIIAPHARWFLDSQYSLIPFYAVLALPFTFRSLDAGIKSIDLRTLVDASRSLGAGWGKTLSRVLIPNLRTAIISSSFLTATVVLGEYTLASLLLKNTLPVYMAQYQQRDGQGGMALALLALVTTTALLAVLTVVTRKRGQARAASVF
jgi:putative spermidine/putrescine transport system permease protein